MPQVWHRCLNSGDNTFLQLCAQYVHMLEPPAQNPLALMYGSYIRELLQTFSKCNHAYQRETEYEDSRILRLSQVWLFSGTTNEESDLNIISQAQLVSHIPPLLKQLTKLLECDLQASP